MSEIEEQRAHILHRARNYPYTAPTGSYTWENGHERPFKPEDRVGRVPVLAVGSNRAPERLAQKFGHLGDHIIPVERAHLTDFDVVYAAHITAYGAVPAMLQFSAGVTVELAVTWLDEAQLPIMHATELGAANYEYRLLDGIELRLNGKERLDHVFLYVSTRGHLRGDDGEAIPLLALRAKGRTGSGRATGEVLEVVRERYAPKLESDAFIFKLVEDKSYREDITAEISKNAVPFNYETGLPPR
ncbi:MAG: hypothetical protein P1V34_05855 [Alphaproteobacteria bacterium]|nr:hypothetical protein [Alphaproteobacteria bacterium]